VKCLFAEKGLRLEQKEYNWRTAPGLQGNLPSCEGCLATGEFSLLAASRVCVGRVARGGQGSSGGCWLGGFVGIVCVQKRVERAAWAWVGCCSRGGGDAGGRSRWE